MLLTVSGQAPRVDPTAWVAPQAVVVGDVRLFPRVSVWYAAVVRGDGDAISVGTGSNLQDGVVLHTDPGFPLRIGRGVSVGHNAVLHGCVIEDDVLIGMGAVVMNGAVIGHGSMVAAGALVTAGTVIPPRSLVVGAPGKVRRGTSEEELAGIALNAAFYEDLRTTHANAEPA